MPFTKVALFLQAGLGVLGFCTDRFGLLLFSFVYLVVDGLAGRGVISRNAQVGVEAAHVLISLRSTAKG